MSVVEKVQCQKIDKYYFKDPKGFIRKYSQYCRRVNCKTESSYNYENLKPKYCSKHKKEDMVNTKKDINYVQNVNLLIKQNVFQKNANIQFKNINQLQNI